MEESKIVFISGANKGLGLEAARQIAQEGHTVILGSRNIEKGEQALKFLLKQGCNAELVQLDVTNADSITKATQWITNKFSRLDVLVNNAGQIINEEWLGNTTGTISISSIKDTLEINLFGVINLTRSLMPLLHASQAGRIVNVSSIMGSLTYHSTPDSPIYDSKPFAYDVSKTALNQYSVHLAHLLKGTNMKVYSAHPGWVKTELGGEFAPMSLEDGAKTIVALSLDNVDFPSGSYIHLNDHLPW